MTMGTMDFMTSSGLRTPIEAMPTPALAVPYAAPKPVDRHAVDQLVAASGRQATGNTAGTTYFP